MTSRRPLCFGLAIAFLALAPTARAERAPGRRALVLRAAARWNAPVPIEIDALRGRLVVLEFFRTDCPHCRAAVPALNALQRAWFDRGVRVVGATRDHPASIEAYVRDLAVAYPVVLVDTEVMRDYEVSSVPSAFLVGPDGRILWTGAPAGLSDGELARWLAAAPPWPALPAALDGVARALREDRWGDARDAVVACERPGACAADVVVAAAAMRAWIDRAADGLVAAAEGDLARGDVYEAWRTLDRLARGLRAQAPGPAAAARVEAILADPARRREVDAGRAYDAARDAWATTGREAGIAALEAAGRAHPGTTAGARAAETALRLRRRP